MTTAAIKALKILATILKDLIENDGKNIATLLLVMISVVFGLFFLIVMPVTIHERVPLATQEQATWYWQAAREVSEMTQSPCDDGVQLNWQEVIAIDTVRLNQNFKKSSPSRAKDLALQFIEETGTCSH
jgi:Na+/melibiose symporter-like transporter